ncbi:MAG: hypothetical protein M1536_06495 [Firmicutes bacterium]|nr:hypothetical protein [Bacillota bacterium]
MLSKRILLFAVIFLIFTAFLNAEELVVYIRNQPVSEKPLIIGNDFYLTVYTLKEALKKEISIDPVSCKVIIDGKVTELEPLQKNGKAYLSLKPLAKYIGMKVSYNKDTGILDMCFDKPAQPKVVKISSPAENYRLLGIKPEDKDKIMNTKEEVKALQEPALKFLEIRFGLIIPKPKLIKTDRFHAWPFGGPYGAKVIEFDTGKSRDETLMILVHEHTHLWMAFNSKWPYRTCFVMEEAFPDWTMVKFAQFVDNKKVEQVVYDNRVMTQSINLFRQIENKYGETGVIEFFRNPYNYPEGKNWKPTGNNLPPNN